VIARLEGTLVRDGRRIIVDVAGVGYDVTCSHYTTSQLPEDGSRVSLRIYTQVRENAIALFGFIDSQERDLFDLLLDVKNVGPTTAVTILGGANPRDIAALIARQDVPGLTKIKGIGKKTAELLCVEIHEKCEMLLLSWNADGVIRPAATASGALRPKSTRHPLLDEVAGALVGMGWRPAEAEGALLDLEVAADSTLETLIVQALRKMPR
jgi:Holliday junction DNA helicase RuvA